MRFIIVLFCLGTLNVLGQEKLNYVFDHLNQSTGFPAKSASKIQNDKNGVIWMLTEKGIMKYNGHSGKFYGVKKDSSGLLNQAYNLYIDKAGLIWVGYLDACISCFNPITETFKHYYHSEEDSTSFPNGGANKFLEDSKGNFWIAVWGGGLSMMDRKSGKFKTYRPDLNNPKAINTDAITEVVELKNGKFLVGCWEDGAFSKTAFLQYFDPIKNEFTRFPVQDYTFANEDEKKRLPSALKIIRFIYQERDNIWVGTFDGLVCIDNKNKTITRHTGYAGVNNEGGFATYENVTNCLEYGNHLWVTTEVAGIMLVDLTTKHCSYINHNFNLNSTISSDAIRAIYKDKDNNIWIATNGGGIDVYCPIRQQFKLYSNEKLLAEKANRAQGQTAITCLLVSKYNNNIYLSHGNGFSVYNQKTDSVYWVDTRALYLNQKIINVNTKYRASNVYSIIEISENELLVNLANISFVYNIKTKKAQFSTYKYCTNTSKYAQNNERYYVKQQKDVVDGVVKRNEWWLYRANDTNFSIHDSTLMPKWIFSTNLPSVIDLIAPLGKDNWYVNYNRFLFYIFNSKSKTFKAYSARKGIENFPDSMIKTLMVDGKSYVWIRTESLLYRFDYRTGKTINYSDVLGLAENEVVQSITEDKDSVLWIGLKQDLIRYNPKTGDKFRFTKGLGLNVGNFSAIQTNKNYSNEVFIAGAYGLLRFDPHQLNFSKTQPELNITGIVINKDTLNEAELNNFITGNRLLKWNRNFITFEFATNQYYTPGAKKYKYRLLGLDSTWYNNENRNYVGYTNLAGGNYTLEVVSKSVYGIESKMLSFSFKIGLPFWKTWWFISIVIVLLIISIRYYVKFREKKLNADNEKLENTVSERTREVTEKSKQIESQNELIQEKNKELTDSIKYAERIQKTLLAHKDFMEENLPEHFVFFNPKDIVSGDFYWASAVRSSEMGDGRTDAVNSEHRTNNSELPTPNSQLFYLAICDSTGHGVPGAFMSLLNISFLNEAVSEKRIVQPNLVLNHVRSKLIEGLSQEGGRDGMDGTLICYDKKNNVLQYASAHNKPILVRDNVIKELPADKMPIGKGEKEDSFTLNTIELIKGDILYFYTDGFADQFGGPKGKKFKYRQLNELLLSISTNSIKEQKEILQNNFNAWKGGLEQVDDVLLIGIKF